VPVADEELIPAAAALLRPYRAGDRLFGDVAAVLVTAEGNRCWAAGHPQLPRTGRVSVGPVGFAAAARWAADVPLLLPRRSGR
jgi:hypothetical protein